MKRIHFIVAATIALFVLGNISCGDNACTLASCQDGIWLSFEDGDGQPIEGFMGDITGDGETINVACERDGSGSGDNYRCTQLGTVMVEVSGVDEISLNVRAEAESSALAYVGGKSVSFSEVRPNGPDCSPVCDQANVTVTMVPTQADGS